MKRLSLLLFISFTISTQIAFGQKKNYEFGGYTTEEMEMKEYAPDKAAEAVVLYDIGVSYFSDSENGFDVIFERRTKIKILSKAGLKWAEMSIPIYEDKNKFEELYSLEGNTYTYNNGSLIKTKLDDSKVYIEKINNHWSAKKFAMPNVNVGSVIEIKYAIRSPYLFNLRSWEFQNRIPTVYSEYITKMTPFYDYVFFLQGASKLSEYKSYKEIGVNRFGPVEYENMAFKFVMTNVPAFRDEAYITSIDDYLIKINFQLATIHPLNGGKIEIMKTWPKLSSDLLDEEAFGSYIKSAKKKAKEITDGMNLTTLSAKEKAIKIDQYVKNNFNWNGVESKFASKSVKEFLASKTGNSADINLFLVGMLQSVGIETNPVIMSTRSNGRIKTDHPFEFFYNYSIANCRIDSTNYLLDSTEPLCGFNILPTRCLNEKGFVVQKNKEEWVTLKNKTNSKMIHNFTISFNNANDSIYYNTRLITSGYDAVDYRNRYHTQITNLRKSLLGNNELASDSLNVSNSDDYKRPFELNYRLKFGSERVDNKVIVTPFANLVPTENELKQPTRSYPIDMTYSKSRFFQCLIKIPKGYTVFSLPADLHVENQNKVIGYHTEETDNHEIKVIANYEFKKDRYEAEEYNDLKAAFNQIISKFNEKIILVKENTTKAK